jgi:hypothetical protein
MAGPPSPTRLRNAPFAANMDYQALLAALLVGFILAAAFVTLCYSPLPLKDDWSGQPVKWLRLAGTVRPSDCKIQITLLTGPGLWPFIRHLLAVP